MRPITWVFPILLAWLLAGCSPNRGSFSSWCNDMSCLTSVQSGKRIYRFSLTDSKGVLEQKVFSGGKWIQSAVKPELEGYTVAAVFKLQQNLLVAHCDEFGNRRFLKFNPQRESWSRGRFETGGCSNR